MRRVNLFKNAGAKRQMQADSPMDPDPWEGLTRFERRSFQSETLRNAHAGDDPTNSTAALSVLADLRERGMLTAGEFRDQKSKVFAIGTSSRGKKPLALTIAGVAVACVVALAILATPSTPGQVKIDNASLVAFSGQSIVSAAAGEAGLPYCFDGGTPNGPSEGSCGSGTVGFDCTGLTLYAVYQASGHAITLPHDSSQASAAIADGGQVISNQSDLQPGDLVYFGGALSDFEHAGVYAGGGEFWDANDYGIPVQEHSMAWEQGGSGGLPFVGAVRLWSTGTPSTTSATPTTSSGHPETTGGVTHTWTNYSDAGGTEGANIGSNQTVQVTCAVEGFKVADGNTWWYEIASTPWNNAYYASADAFYNNGATSGSLNGTPFVDPAIPACGSSTAPPPANAQMPPSSTAPTTSSGHPETTGGVTHTWTNYSDAGGTEGANIGSNQTVQVTCAVEGFKVADGNTWWYEIASTPWNNAFYASADAFYNNGATSGSLNGTPFVDPAIPACGSPTAPPTEGSTPTPTSPPVSTPTPPVSVPTPPVPTSAPIPPRPISPPPVYPPITTSATSPDSPHPGTMSHPRPAPSTDVPIVLGPPGDQSHRWGPCTVRDYYRSSAGWVIVVTSTGHPIIVEAHLLHEWLSAGGASGHLGCPTSPAHATRSAQSHGLFQSFQHGTLYWTTSMSRA